MRARIRTLAVACVTRANKRTKKRGFHVYQHVDP